MNVSSTEITAVVLIIYRNIAKKDHVEKETDKTKYVLCKLGK